MGFLDNVVKSLPSISAKFQSHFERHIALRQARAMGPAGWTTLWGVNPSTCNPYSLYSGGTNFLGGNNNNMITSIFGGGQYGSYNPYTGGYNSGLYAPQHVIDIGTLINNQVKQEMDPGTITIPTTSNPSSNPSQTPS